MLSMFEDKKSQFQEFITTQLNPSQKEAVCKKDGSLLVIAGAGSGKTRVITARITNLILEHNVDPGSIVALTFTNKAAKEMQQRVASFLNDYHLVPTVATFHSYCLRLLKQYQHLLPFDQFSILDSADQQKMLQNIIKLQGFEKRINVKQILYTISSYKNNDAIGAHVDDTYITNSQDFNQIYNAYEKEKRASKCLDFDDLLIYTLKLFQNNEAFKKKYQQQIRHILVDEYQDTNAIQNELLKYMALTPAGKLAIDSICAVGDEDQSIYSWRGATIANILNFNKEFDSAQTIKIEQNYRSTQSILEVANSVIANNTNRNHKNLWSDKKGNHKPIKFECNSEFQEANIITHFVETIQHHESLKSIAILYRTHYQSRILEEAMIKASIPYKIIGGIQFYDRKEIKDLLAYLRLAYNPFDRVSFSRIINCPTRGLGQKFEEAFFNTWNTNSLYDFKQIAQLILEEKLTKTKHQALEKFLRVFKSINEKTTPLQAAAHIIEQTGYITYLQDSFDASEAQIKRENIQEFLRALEHFEQEGVITISQLLDEIALMQDRLSKQEQAQDFVHMMTLHSAKGLEFDNIVLTGLEDGMLPSSQSINEENIEEERRLFYVGITRAKKRLLLTHSRTRNTYGQTNVQVSSRFLDEISPNLLIEQPATYWSTSQFKTYFKQWIKGHSPQTPATDHVKTFSQYIPKNVVKKEKKLGKFKKLQTVEHKKFGLGIIHSVEEKGPKKIYVTVRFYTHGLKKIDSNFLTVI